MKYTKKRFAKRKPYKKKAYKGKIGTTMDIAAINSPLTRTLKASMIYTSDTGLSLVSSATNPGTKVFTLNGLYDPDISGSGHQPRGFDELILLYDHAVVINTKVRIDIWNNLSTSGAYVIATIRDNSAPSTNYIDYTETSNSKWVLLSPATGGSACTTIYLDVNPNEFLGLPNPMSNPELKGSAAKNPDEQAYLHISGMSDDNFTACSVLFMVTLEYTAIFVEPKQVAAS